jgi:hypothetical protein
LLSSSANADDPVVAAVNEENRQRGILQTPTEPVIGFVEGETRSRGMTIGKWVKATI